MIVTIREGDEYWPRYKGCWVTSSITEAAQWEDKNEIPDENQRLSEKNGWKEQGRTCVPRAAVWFVWFPMAIFPENEFGVECP
jgi:hypothetical protein